MEFEAVIGLETHVQLMTESKIFCGCSTKFGAPPNHNTCPVCLGLPGALPVLNEKAVELALRAAIAFSCDIRSTSVFARKNYFYPDLPKGYQISQYDQPLAIGGQIEIPVNDSSRRIRIRRIHLEEDAGKLLHEGIEGVTDASFVDLNRSGVPLIEIVSEPEIASPQEAHSYLSSLKMTLQYCEISFANMEEGNLRCDANISLREKGSERLGTRVEIKNLNSFRNVQKALEFEIDRQRKLLLDKKQVEQETRLFNANRGITESMRTKEEAHDYRYFPEPDLLPLKIADELLERVRDSLPELPEKLRTRFVEQYQLGGAEAEALIEDRALAGFYEETVKLSGNAKQAANWILRDVLEKLKEHDQTIRQSTISPRHIAGLIELLEKGTISNTQAREVFNDIWNTGRSAAEIVREKDMSQISDDEALRKITHQVIQENHQIAERFKKGEAKLQGVLVGLVMKATGGKANPAMVNRLLKEELAQ